MIIISPCAEIIGFMQVIASNWSGHYSGLTDFSRVTEIIQLN
jgi:hypothetical protein